MLNQMFDCVSPDEVTRCQMRIDQITVDCELKEGGGIFCGQFEVGERRGAVIY
jgi:hypothetical protein